MMVCGQSDVLFLFRSCFDANDFNYDGRRQVRCDVTALTHSASYLYMSYDWYCENMYLMACAEREDLEQLTHAHGLIRLFLFCVYNL